MYLKQLERELKIRNYSPKTVKAYTMAMSGYFKFFVDRGQDFGKFWGVGGAGEDFVKDFLLHKKEQNCSPKTLNVYLSAIKFFYKEILKIPHQLDVKFAKRNRKLPTVLSHQEIIDIIRNLQNLKHRLIISLAYGAGLRVSEVTNLKISDLDFERKIIYVRHGKGGKDRITVLPEALTEDLNEFIAGRRGDGGSDGGGDGGSGCDGEPNRGNGGDGGSDSEPNRGNGSPSNSGVSSGDRGPNNSAGPSAGRDLLFLSQRGGKLSTRTLQKIFQNTLRKAGIVKPASFHSLRHSFATYLIENGTNIRYVQELLGHQNIRTTQMYTHVTRSFIANIKSPL